MKKVSKRGRVTIPTESGFVDETLKLLEQWGADAVRDCDGTAMPEEIKQAGYKIYSTYFVARGDNEFAKRHPEERTHFYLMSERQVATSDRFSVDLLKGYFSEQVQPDYSYDPKKWWEVIDRTSGETVPQTEWHTEEKTNSVVLEHAHPFHEYTATYLARAIWDSTQMYNYITNNWTKEKDLPFDARCPETNRHVVEAMNRWLDAHPDTDVVRFTTFFYHFTLVFNQVKKEKFVDWFGYSGSVSVPALEAFEKEYGYRLSPEDIVDAGFYNTPFRVPSKRYLDYMDFTQRFVADKAKELVDVVHKRGKEAMMFLGDNWIGTEPYGKHFPGIGLDAVVGSVGGGVTVRMLSDIPGVKYTEGRFLPYFFPDTFHEGGHPTEELKKNWLTARRAIMKKPIDRIGWGGYLSLAAKFPDFVLEMERICNEFRDIYDKVKGHAPHSNLKVAVMNAWGKIRSWQCYMVAHELWYKQIYSYQGILEALSGMPVDVDFISFDEVLAEGIPKDVDVVINAGDAGTAFSGGEYWTNPRLMEIIREWVYNGGGFIGVGEPTAQFANGKFFALSDVLGVEKELGFTLSTDKYNWEKHPAHFITEDAFGEINYGEGKQNVYASDTAEILDVKNGDVLMAVNRYGKGRSFYMAGLPYNVQNLRILYRALHWTCGKEQQLKKWFADNTSVECQYYPDLAVCGVVNNSDREVDTVFYDGNGKSSKLHLKGGELVWVPEK